MATLPGGFSPWQAIQQVADDLNPFDGGSRDRDIFSQKYNQRNGSPIAVPINTRPGGQPTGNDDSGSYSGSYSGGSGGGGGGYSAAETQALYDDQIAQLNTILGTIGTQRNQGLTRLQQSALDAKNRLTEQKNKTMQGYDQQSLKNAQDKQRGVEQVDDFANNSYKNLQRVLQGGNAGNSSVGRQLVPQLVSKSAGTRRQGVFNAAGENDASIASARGDAEDQYGYSFQDLENQRKSQQENFLSGIYQQEQDLYGKRAGIEAQKAAATGAGYEGVRAATAGSRAEIDSRAAQLNALFGQFAPTFNAKAVNTKTPDLKSYQIDPALIKGDQSIPQESRFYLPNLKKKEDNQGL